MKKLLYILTLSLLFIFCISSTVVATKTTDKPNVLFISSYSFDFDTIPLQIEGINSVLTDEIANLNIEFMDTKRFSTNEDLKLFYSLLKNKLDKLPPYDAVIVGDDAALIFALEYHNELFYKTPVVFLGINSFELAEVADKNYYFTGIVEETSYEQNIDMARKLCPNATKVVGIVDNTLTGIGDQTQFLLNSEKFPEYDFHMINSSELTKKELGKKIATLDKETMLFYLSMFEDKDGNQYTIKQSSQYISSHAKIPVFRMSIGGVGDGLTGGIMVSYDESGRIAAKMVTEILAGVPPDVIEVVMKSPNFPYFDYNMLDLHKIPNDKLPENSIILNEPISFFVEYRSMVEIVIIAFCFLLLILFMLGYSNIRKKVMMNTDFLTNMKNRMWLTHKLTKLLNKSKPCAVFFMDLDDFKTVNDSLGHAIGDELLIQVAGRIRAIKDKDIEIARFGGDEFFGIINNADKDVVMEKCKKILSIFDERFWVKNNEIIIHASLGVSFAPGDSNEADVLLSFADTAMYDVKTSGKNNIHFFNFAMKNGLERQEFISKVLRKAVKENSFYVAYQPQIRSGTREVVGFEALVRLKGEEALPYEFIPIAEENGLIIPMSRLVTKQVVYQIAKWHKEGYGNIHVAINFSNAQLRDAEYPNYIKELLEEYHVSPDLLEIEITESIFLKQTDESVSFINQFYEYGIALSMDDFGTGYSAINYLSYVPFNKLKIDKSLLDKYAKVNKSKTIASIIDLAHSLGLLVTAEGIENEEMAEIVESHGCDYMQGYLFGKPTSNINAEQYLKKKNISTS